MSQIPLTPEQILQGVQDVLSDALGIDNDEATPKARVVNELGAESIDFLDIHFRLEKKFQITLKGFPATHEEDLHDPMTPQVIEMLKERMPFIEVNQYLGRPLEDVCTVEFYCKLVTYKLQTLSATAAV